MLLAWTYLNYQKCTIKKSTFRNKHKHIIKAMGGQWANCFFKTSLGKSRFSNFCLAARLCQQNRENSCKATWWGNWTKSIDLIRNPFNRSIGIKPFQFHGKGNTFAQIFTLSTLSNLRFFTAGCLHASYWDFHHIGIKSIASIWIMTSFVQDM